MSRVFRANSWLAAALFVGGLQFLQAANATAQVPAAESAIADDILGLRPGMSYGEVVALLEARDDVQLVETAEQWIRQSHGIPTRQLLRASDGIACGPEEKASRSGWHTECDTLGGRFQARKQVSNEIIVAFTGMPEGERARSVWRRSVFAEGKSPTVSAVIEALAEKYGKPHVHQTESGYYSTSHRRDATNLNWVYAPTGSLIQGNDSLLSGCVNGPKPWFTTEHSWSGGCGMTIRAEILPVPGNTLLAQALNVTVVNQNGLIEALGRFDIDLKAAVEQRVEGTAEKPEL
ncbi:MAG: hypothetical protein ACFCUT_04640 [Kiloniellaceae bacterium]